MLTAMNRRALFLLTAFPAITAYAAGSAWLAKEPTCMLVISGGGLMSTQVIKDSATLALSDVYAGRFMDTTRPPVALPAGVAKYQISFYLTDYRRSALVRLITGRRVFRAYVADFALDSARGMGYVYLPGDGDPWASWNHGTIIRAGRDGRWSYATPEWTRGIAAAIAHARRAPEPACPIAGGSGELLRQTDSAYRDAQELSGLLEAHGLHVLCSYPTTMAGMLGEWHAAAFMTNRGVLSALFFPPPSGAEVVTMTSTVKNGQLITVLHGPNAARPVDSLYGADPAGIVIYRRWLIQSFSQPGLDSAIRAAIGAPIRSP
ncbi:MAG TPA: hypothetical protein VII52_08015 [Gemmatimonadaceae bacterium]